MLILLAALGWGIYRDVTHFRHLVAGGELSQPLSDEFDALAAAFLVLGAVKTGYHGIHALRVLAHLSRS